MRNRHGEVYSFVQIGEDEYTITGDLRYWRYGGREGQEQMDYGNLGFVDPSGGPFIELGMQIAGRKIVNISAVNEKIIFKVE